MTATVKTTLRETVAFYVDKGTPDDYCPSVNLGELKALLADLDARPVVNLGDTDPPLPEDYPAGASYLPAPSGGTINPPPPIRFSIDAEPTFHDIDARPAKIGGTVSMEGLPSSVTDNMVMSPDEVARRYDQHLLLDQIRFVKPRDAETGRETAKPGPGIWFGIDPKTFEHFTLKDLRADLHKPHWMTPWMFWAVIIGGLLVQAAAILNLITEP